MNRTKYSRQWKFIKQAEPRLCGVVLYTMQGFLVVHNRSPKPLARLKHALTQIQLQKA